MRIGSLLDEGQLLDDRLRGDSHPSRSPGASTFEKLLK